MLTRILRYIKGYVRIRITGYSPERFLNLCKYRKIPVWGLLPGRNFYDMNITIAGMKKLKPILKKTGTNLRILEKNGLPFFLFRHRKRKIFFAGLLDASLSYISFPFSSGISKSAATMSEQMRRFCHFCENRMFVAE